MSSEDTRDLLRVVEDMVQDRREDIVKKSDLKRQMELREDWDEIRFEETETELIRSGAVAETLNGEQLQVHRFEL